MNKKIIALTVLTAVASSEAFAGAANLSITNVRGSGSSVTFANGSSSLVESARGFRHLDSSTGGDISVRNEFYRRGTVRNDGYSEVSAGSFRTAGTIIDATRIGESEFRTTSTSSTVGVATSNRTSVENGVFNAYDRVNDSYSYESGIYTAVDTDSSLTLYGSSQYANTYSTSAYAIYGAN